ncbi:MAG: peptidylprolyl isomerase, partial [Chitinophagaceae bacterium]|nr:peptidylprolyl isomerase [Chitinophagaceae bacterium]
HYTVFGEIIEGAELIEKLSAVKTAADDTPLEPVKIKLILLN